MGRKHPPPLPGFSLRTDRENHVPVAPGRDPPLGRNIRFRRGHVNENYQPLPSPCQNNNICHPGGQGLQVGPQPNCISRARDNESETHSKSSLSQRKAQHGKMTDSKVIDRKVTILQRPKDGE